MISRRKPVIEIKDASSGNLKNASLSITPGTFVLVTGPIGSGKSSLLMGVIAQEASQRIAQLRTPNRLLVDNFPKQAINNLPRTLSLSGEDPTPSSQTIGESFGLFKLLGALLKESKFRTCPTCQSPLKRTDTTEQIELILKKTSLQKNSTVKIIALTNATNDTYEEAKASWLKNGFEMHGPLTSRNDSNQFYFETTIDIISSKDISSERLRESIHLFFTSSALSCRIELSSSHGSITDNIWIYRNWFCSRCFEEYSNLKPSDFEPANISRPVEKLSVLAKCIIDHTAIDPNFQYTGRMLSRLPLLELRSIIDRFCPDAKIIQERISLIIDSGITQQKLTSSLQELSPSQYLTTKLAKLFAMASESSLIVLDEPIITWEQSAFTYLSARIKSHIQKGGTVIISTMRPEFAELADATVHLGPGSGIEGGNILPSVPTSPQSDSKKSTNYYVQQIDQSMPTVEISWKEIKPSKKTTATLLKLNSPIAILFSSTVTAKSLALSEKEFSLEPAERSLLANQVTFKDMTLYQIEELTIKEAADFFADVLKIKNRLEPAIKLGLGHLKIGQIHSSMSLRERILISLASLIATNPNNKLIIVNQILDLLPTEIVKEITGSLPLLLPKKTSVKFIATHPAIRDLPNCWKGVVAKN